MADVELRPRGPFSLTAVARFGRGFTPSPTAGGEDVVRLAFAAEAAGWETVGIEARAEADAVAVSVAGDADPQVVARDVARILSLDVDGSTFDAVAERDPVAGALQARFPGLRPVLFPSPYEAAVWAVLSQRARMAQAAAVKARLTEALGAHVEIGGEALRAFPGPARLAGLGDAVRGLPARKAEQLRALARAALDGELAPGVLRSAADPVAALRAFPGIGPFSAELVLIRGAGDPDRFPWHEGRLHGAMRRAYGLAGDAPVADLAAIAGAWAPYRSWVALLFRRALDA